MYALRPSKTDVRREPASMVPEPYPDEGPVWPALLKLVVALGVVGGFTLFMVAK